MNPFEGLLTGMGGVFGGALAQGPLGMPQGGFQAQQRLALQQAMFQQQAGLQNSTFPLSLLGGLANAAPHGSLKSRRELYGTEEAETLWAQAGGTETLDEWLEGKEWRPS